MAERSVSGGACGYYTNVSIFGGPRTLRGCGQTTPPGNADSASPSVTLPAGGSSKAISATDSDGALAEYGPAVLFGGKPPANPNALVGRSGSITVSTKGKRSVTSTASVRNLSAGPFVGNAVRATCTASTSGRTGSTRVTKGVLITAMDAAGNVTASETIPTDPTVNYALEGSNNVGDRFRAVFNEQTVDEAGGITVIGLHIYLLGPTAVGDVVVAQASARA